MRVQKSRLFAAVVTVGLLGSGAALAGVGSLISDLVSGKSAFEGFTGNWVVSDKTSDIDHMVISPSGDVVRIQVFGRCENRICNWGALPARVRFARPESDQIQSLSADFNLGYALRHITLHRLPGNALRFDMVTEFTDGSDRHDYEAMGKLVIAGTPMAAAQPAAAPAAVPAPAAAPAAPPVAAPAPRMVPAPSAPTVAPVQTAPDPVLADAPLADTGPVVSGTTPDYCFKFDTAHVYVTPTDGNWAVRDFLHPVVAFGPYRVAANKAMSVITNYRLDEVCRIGRNSANLLFFRASGEVPHVAMANDQCEAVAPDKVVAVERDDDWKVVDGGREIFNYGSDKDGATQAASLIKTYGLNKQCFFDKANTPVSYWLAQ